MKVEPVKLNGRKVILEPLSVEHVEGLCEFGFDEGLWKWTINTISNENEMLAYVESALRDRDAGVSLPFVTKIINGDKIVGSTRFCNIDRHNKRVEIGWTWIDPEWQRSFVNTEAKLAMLTHAFEVWKCNRVELKTDDLNQRSRNAMLRIGATEEGVLRNHMITDRGRLRNTAYFSIIESEWQKVRAGLEARLGNR